MLEKFKEKEVSNLKLGFQEIVEERLKYKWIFLES
jgi:hypothetical protein